MSKRSAARPSVQATPPIRFAHDDKSSKSSPKKSGGFLSFLWSFGIRVGLFYLLIGALWSCGSKPLAFDYSLKDPRPVCRTLAQSKAQLVPIVTPYYNQVRSKVDPYTQPYINAARPHVKRAWKTAKPYYKEAGKRTHNLWKKHGEPQRRKALRRFKTATDPHIATVKKEYAARVQPHVDNLHKTTKPYYDTYQRDVSPYVNKGYNIALTSAQTSASFYLAHVQPVIVRILREVYAFHINHVDPAVRRGYSRFVRPQLEKIWQKVWRYEASAVGKQAIAKAKAESSQSAKEGKKAGEAAVESAKASAVRAQQSPTFQDRINQAKDAVTGKVPSDEDPIVAAALDAELEAEIATTKEQLEVWERGLGELIEKEYKLLTEHLAELRNRRLADLPDRFATLTDTFVEDEAATALSRLERGFKRLSAETNSSPLDERIDEAKTLVDGQKQRIAKSRDALKASVIDYAKELETDEIEAVEASAGQIWNFVQAAKKDYAAIDKKTRFQATSEKFEGWIPGIVKRADMYELEISAVQTGKKAVRKGIDAVDLSKEADLHVPTNDLVKRIDALYGSVLSEIDSYARSGVLALRGEGVRLSISDTTDAIAARANAISEEAASVMLSAALLAREKLGLGPKPEKGILAKLSNKAADAAQGAAGQAKAAYDQAGNAASSIGASISSVASQGSSQASVAASQADNSASSVAAVVASSASSAANQASASGSSAASQARSAARSAAAAAGATPSPEGFVEHVQSIANGAVDVASDAYGAATSNAGNVASGISSAAAGAASALSDAVIPTTAPGEKVSKAVKDAASSASSQAGGLIDNASSAVGAAAESASSVASVAASSASSAASVAASVVSSVASGQYDAVSSAASNQYAAASSVVSSQYDAASSVASSAASVASSAVSEKYDAASSAASNQYDAASSAASNQYDAASSAVSSGADAVASQYDAGTSIVSKASRSAASAVGATPTPETASEYYEAAKDAVVSGAGSAAGVVKDALSGTPDLEAELPGEIPSDEDDFNSVGKAAKAGVEKLAEVAKPYASSASSVLSQASRSVASAVGSTPTPETFADYSEDAKQQAADAARAAEAQIKGLADAINGAAEAIKEKVRMGEKPPTEAEARELLASIKSAAAAATNRVKEEL